MYSEGSLKGSGVDSYSEDYGTFTCEGEDCGHENLNALKFVDDWGDWSVTCEKCDTTYASGNINDTDEDAEYDRLIESQLMLDD